MFTGIVEELGTVRAIAPAEGGARIEIAAKLVLDDAEIGASIAVNGCCLTVVDLGCDPDGARWWTTDAVTETLARTSLGALREGDRVNLERPVRAADRLGGHVVQGHVDAVGQVRDCSRLPDGSTLMTVAAPPAVLRYVVEKGSVAIDGVSLTVAALAADAFAVALIPHTLAVTTFGTRAPGDLVNLEVDVLAKYVERLLTAAAPGFPAV
jgi:riboflavin synthase